MTTERRKYGYCVHGKYVGGVGRDILCGPCEVGATYRILDLPLWEIHTREGIIQSRRKYENLEFVHLVENYPDSFFLTYRKDDAVWATRQEAVEALNDGYVVVSPWAGKVYPNPYETGAEGLTFREEMGTEDDLVYRILNIVKAHDASLYVKLQDYVREQV